MTTRGARYGRAQGLGERGRMLDEAGVFAGEVDRRDAEPLGQRHGRATGQQRVRLDAAADHDPDRAGGERLDVGPVARGVPQLVGEESSGVGEVLLRRLVPAVVGIALVGVVGVSRPPGTARVRVVVIVRVPWCR